MVNLTRKVVLACLTILLPMISEAQTCLTSTIPATTPTSRFHDNNNGTVTDTKTQLMWKKCSEGQMWDEISNTCSNGNHYYTWGLALNMAKTANSEFFANYTDWRMPNLTELHSIVERQCYGPAINLTIFPNVSDYYSSWSSSVNSSDASKVSYIYFYDGSDYGSSKDDSVTPKAVRLVRGAL